MPKDPQDRDGILNAIRNCAASLNHSPTRREFQQMTGLSEYHVTRHFPEGFREAVCAAGLQPNYQNIRYDDATLLQDWGELVRKIRQIPTRNRYKHEGRYSASVFDNHFGPWSGIPSRFREFANGKPEWSDVLPLLPVDVSRGQQTGKMPPSGEQHLVSHLPGTLPRPRHTKLPDRSTYGAPIDFRGLRHEPVTEQGVVFLFGMVARELGYMVEAVQQGFPDCEAKRQVEGGKWQRVRIEFEFESRSYNHPIDGCDVIVCWRHNWAECPATMEVIELQKIIKTLAKSDE